MFRRGGARGKGRFVSRGAGQGWGQGWVDGDTACERERKEGGGMEAEGKVALLLEGD